MKTLLSKTDGQSSFRNLHPPGKAWSVNYNSLFILLIALLMCNTFSQWSLLECEILTQNMHRSIQIRDKELLGIRIDGVYGKQYIFDIYYFNYQAFYQNSKRFSHTFVKNFPDKGKVVVSSDLSFLNIKQHFPKLNLLNLQNNVKSEPENLSNHLKQGEIWKNFVQFLTEHNSKPNILIVGLHIKGYKPVVEKLKGFAYWVEYLEELEQEQLELFDLIILSPLNLCRNPNSENLCNVEIEKMIQFRDKSVFNTSLIVTEIPKKYKFEKLGMFYQIFLSLITDSTLEITTLKNPQILLNSCLSKKFHSPLVPKFKDVETNFDFYQEIDFSRYQLKNFIQEFNSAKSSLLECINRISFFDRHL